VLIKLIGSYVLDGNPALAYQQIILMVKLKAELSIRFSIRHRKWLGFHLA